MSFIQVFLSWSKMTQTGHERSVKAHLIVKIKV